MKLKNLGITVATTGLLLGVSQTTQAQTAFRNTGIQFKEDTIIEFEFVESHGAYRSTFGVIDLDSCQANFGSIDFDTCQRTPLLVEEKASDFPERVTRRSTYEDDESQTQDFLGTPGNAVPQPRAEFMFEAGKRFAFYLESSFNGMPAGVKYSSAIYNPNDGKQAIFVDNLTPEARQVRRRNAPDDIKLNPQLEEELGTLIDGGIMIRWDDTGSLLVPDNLEDSDFDDFSVVIGGELDCY